MPDNRLTAIIVGAGHRAVGYARKGRDSIRVVGIADPRDQRREMIADEFGIPVKHQFRTAEDLARVPKFADVVINGTMDHQHVPTSLPLIRAGYDILLEKPFAVNEEEMWELVEAAREYRRTVLICHVLRYAPFYAAIRQKVVDDAIGRILNVQTVEHVSSHHMDVAFIRGKWAKKSLCGSSMLMAKCCHDLDIIAWMKSGTFPVRVASFGGNYQFKPEDAPEGAGERCLVDCPIESDCLYSARKIYLDHPNRWSFYVWERFEGVENPTIEQKTESLKTDNPHGRCVWKAGTEMVDHQSVVIEFSDGATATHNMVGGTAKALRSIHLIGTRGEIQGVFEESRFVVRSIAPERPENTIEEVVDLTVGGDMHGAFGGHGGGDERLVEDFVRVVRGEQPSVSTTHIEDSVSGHLVGFSADRAMTENRVVELDATRIAALG
ncbi:MAG TPA: Gfo/Idh/MocA family oxidoreductase [Firmicutes bacterium]|nr:Gfo/Idh/MocA family oxidoreductase [Bacillota bacterium]